MKEIGFYFKLKQLDIETMNSILSKDPACSEIDARIIKGYLTGFVDLICEVSGKYFIIDYKTNYLGEWPEDYLRENLEQAMHSHNYGLQYWLYSLVLHRRLKNNLAGYRYKQHFGGVFYLFVRGMSSSTPGAGVYFSLPEEVQLQRLERLVGDPSYG